MNKYQRGATMWSTLTVALMAGFLAYLTFAVGSIYLDYSFIKASMQKLVDQSNFKTMTHKTMLSTINKRLTIDNIRGLEKDVITVKKDKSGERYLKIHYVAKTHIIAEVHVLVEFDDEIRTSR